MRNALFQAICKAGIFMICAQAIVHFRPHEAYEKYLKLLVSVMVLIQLFLPVGSFLLGEGMSETAKRLEQFREEMEEELKFAAQEAADADAALERMTLEEVRKRMEEQERKTDESSGAVGDAEASEAGISVIVGPIEIESGD